MSVYECLWAFMSVYERLWAFMRVNEYLWVFMSIYECLWALMSVDEHRWALMSVDEHLWVFMSIDEYLWALMNVYEHCFSVETRNLNLSLGSIKVFYIVSHTKTLTNKYYKLLLSFSIFWWHYYESTCSPHVGWKLKPNIQSSFFMATWNNCGCKVWN